ncbi:MAG: multiheme c-type cytochrome [Leptospirales bacterium]
MNKRSPLFFTIFITLLCIFGLNQCEMMDDMKKMKAPKFETGARSTAQTCKTCHGEIYAQWQNRSRHAVAKSSESYNNFLHKFENNTMLNSMMGTQMCVSCHGPDENGVDCETCHGTASPEEEIMQVHKDKFSPNLSNLKSESFCANCHSIKNPMSGDYMVNTYNDWKNSPAAKSGKTCQNCHMSKADSGLSSHGFKTTVRNIDLYKNRITIDHVQVDLKKVSLQIHNLVSGHYIPAGGPTRVLALQIEYLDHQGKVIHTDVEKFNREFSLMFGLMPKKLLSDSRLKPNETRTITFDISETIQSELSEIRIILNQYEVSDEHKGDIDKAHWKSSDIVDIYKRITKKEN